MCASWLRLIRKDGTTEIVDLKARSAAAVRQAASRARKRGKPVAAAYYGSNGAIALARRVYP